MTTPEPTDALRDELAEAIARNYQGLPEYIANAVLPVVERYLTVREKAAAADALRDAADDWGSQIRNGGAGSWLRARAAALEEPT